jgi:hypothetical protein
MGATKSKWRGGQLAFYDGTTYETVEPFAPVYLKDDFFGTALNTDLWTEVETNNATKAIAASCLLYTLTNTDQVQDAGVYGITDNAWNIDKGLIFEARLAVTVLPTVTSEVQIGVQNDAFVSDSQRVAGADEVAKHCLFVLNGATGTGATLVIYSDDAGVDNDAVATGITVVAGVYHVYRMDFTNSADVKFYYDGTQVVSTSTVKMDTTANLMVKPLLMAIKHGGAGLGAISIDYVRIWQATR